MVMGSRSGVGKSYTSHHYRDKDVAENILKNVPINLAFQWIKVGLWTVSDMKLWFEANGGKQ